MREENRREGREGREEVRRAGNDAYIVAEVVLGALKRRLGAGPLLSNTMGGMKGVLAKGNTFCVGEGDIVVVKLTSASAKHYDSYNYWIGEIVQILDVK